MKLLLGIALLGVLSAANAQSSAEITAFRLAEGAIRTAPTQWQRITAPLNDHPLLPYLWVQAAERAPESFTLADRAQLMDRFGAVPAVAAWRHTWLRDVAKSPKTPENRPELLRYVTADDPIDLVCLHLTALLGANQSANAFRILEMRYQRPEALPPACQPALDAWQAAGGLTVNHQQQRIAALLVADDADTARRVARSLPSGNRAHGWIAAWASATAPWPNALPPDLALALGLRRCRQQPQAMLRNPPPLAADQALAVRRRCLVRLAQQDQTAAALAGLAALPAAGFDREVAELQVRLLVTRRQWDDLIAQQQRWQRTLGDWPMGPYWAARAHVLQGNAAAARPLYQQAASVRDYYGFLAAAQLGTAPRVVDRPVALDGAAQQSLTARLAFRRLALLYALGREADALAEWEILRPTLSQPEQLAAAKQFSRWGWHHHAITLAAQLGEWDDLAWRFPIAHRAALTAEATREGIDPAWAFAIIRKETAFRADAVSSAGALGLMQLMPATAAMEARPRGLPSDARSLRDPAINIPLGVAHLGRLQRQYRHPVLASAAYNAGGGRVDQWRRRFTDRPLDEWIEAIPFKETRDYAKRVLEFTLVYHHQLGSPPATQQRVLRTWLAPIAP